MRLKIKQKVFRKLRNKIKEKKLIEKIPQYSCYQEDKELCTTARNFISRNNYKPPCIITVLRHNGMNKKFFYSHTGLFTYHYALLNHQQFTREITQFNHEYN